MAKTLRIEPDASVLVRSLPESFREALAAVDAGSLEGRQPVEAGGVRAAVEAVPKKTVVLEQGATEADFRVLLAGDVSVERAGGEGKEAWTLDMSWKVDVEWFGEHSLLAREPEPLRWSAKKDCVFLAIARADLDALLRGTDPALADFREYVLSNHEANADSIRAAAEVATEICDQRLFRAITKRGVRNRLATVVRLAVGFEEEAEAQRLEKSEKYYAIHGENWEVAYLERRARGETIVRQGTYDADVRILLSGVVDLLERDAAGTAHSLGQVAATSRKNWFGEFSAISNRPQRVEARAATEGTVLVLSAATFKGLLADDGFKDLVLEEYRKTDLAAQLRTVPLFEGLDERALDRVARLADLPRVAPGTEIAGGASGRRDAFYVVLSGAVQWLLPQEDGTETFHATLCDNASFGEEIFSESMEWTGRYVAETEVDLVELERSDLESLSEEAVAILRENAMRWIERGLARTYRTPAGKYLVKAGRALVIDLEHCTRCNACVDSCVAVHDDGIPRISKRGMRDFEGRQGRYLITRTCHHCETADCLASCPAGAIRRTVGGDVDFIYDACIGCQKCEIACPYDVIRMTDIEPSPAEDAAAAAEAPSIFGLLASWVRGGKGAGSCGSWPSDAPPKQKAVKCDLCAGLPYEACVYNCPYSAIERYTPLDVDRLGIEGTGGETRWPGSS